MKKMVHFFVVLGSVFFLTSCAPKESNTNIFIYQEGADYDTTVPLAYSLYPKSKQVTIIWNEGDRSYLTDLVTFEETDTQIEFVYRGKDKVDVKKTFDRLSDTVVQDEKNIEYQMFGNELD